MDDRFAGTPVAAEHEDIWCGDRPKVRATLIEGLKWPWSEEARWRCCAEGRVASGVWA